MKQRLVFLAIALLLLCGTTMVKASNYPTRREMIANVCTHIRIDIFKFVEVKNNSTSEFRTTYSWTNTGQKEIIAFEIVVLKFDPFNRPLIGSRATFPGTNSATFEPLKPGQSDDDGGITFGRQDVYTAYAFIQSVRFSDNTVWSANIGDVLTSIKKQTPDILEPKVVLPE